MAAANKGSKSRVRSIRFAASHDAESSQSHVHFDEKLHDSVVMVTQESDSSFLVKVGFLKILHRYEITFTLPPVHRLSKDVRETPVPSLHLKLLSVMPIPEGYSVKCEYSAHKEGVLKEEMLLACEGGPDTCVRVMVQARVMDRHHGTPMLLDGVRALRMPSPCRWAEEQFWLLTLFVVLQHLAPKKVCAGGGVLGLPK
uniref:Adipose secreted signaling protein n=1 Tax=Ovis aries TaxID=9940 RepID=A0AC11E2Y8_SHEEP